MNDTFAQDLLASRKRIVLDYLILGKIGEGTYGVVYKVEKNGVIFAVKKFKTLRKSKQGLPIQACREITLLKELSHPNIIELRDVIISPQELSISLLFEYADYDLYEIIRHHRKSKTNFRIREVKTILYQVLRGLAYLHSNWIVHRDIKPSNLLMNASSGEIKIADFGLARRIRTNLRALSEDGTVVTLWYRAPELLLGSKHYTTSIDIWAVGCIFFELVECYPLFPGSETGANSFFNEQCKLIFAKLGKPNVGEWPTLREHKFYPNIKDWEESKGTLEEGIKITGLGYDLLTRMLEYNPSTRISAAEALNHSFFKEEPIPTDRYFHPLTGFLPHNNHLRCFNGSGSIMVPRRSTEVVSGVTL